MLTDIAPRNASRAGFLKSDRIRTLELPNSPALPIIAKSIELGLKAGSVRDVREACRGFLQQTAEFYHTPPCDIRVLAARPLKVSEFWKTELFGDYNIRTMVIRLWMRTAVRKEVTSFGTFLNTLCHEFCHHLDFHYFGFEDSWHTRGFYERTATLYHFSRGTVRKPLAWRAVPGGRWRLDWQRTKRISQGSLF